MLAKLPASMSLSCGVVDGRNVWRTDLDAAQALVTKAIRTLGPARVVVAPSCSLLHVPIDLSREQKLDAEVRSWLAFGLEKLSEIRLLADAANAPADPGVAALLAQNRDAQRIRRNSERVRNPALRARIAELTPAMFERVSANLRVEAQAGTLHLPLFPVTTIGSLPQTADVRKLRADAKAGRLDDARYDAQIREWTKSAIGWQEEAGVDVLVHGEFERNDMVEFFGERLEGAVVTAFGWVLSYGARCVKPPILFGDLTRPRSMTVELSRYAQSLTERPVKGMLTGPATILQWSFVRDDQPRSRTAMQLGLALRDEVAELESAGIRIIQVDEPALREGLPLHASGRAEYLDWAVQAFKLATSAVHETTQIHTHMCYADFEDIAEAIAALDVDVISLESARSDGDFLPAIAAAAGSLRIGPGVYDIHSPVVPTAEDMYAQVERALRYFKPEQLWINPDCGLKTRTWEQVPPAIAAMVEAAGRLRAQYAPMALHRK